jgi:hypothetical protein
MVGYIVIPIFLLINGELKEFRVSSHDSRWGAIGFQYTSSVPYEHRVYEFKIPLNEIDAHIGDEIQYGFGCYGTVAAGIISGTKFNDLNGNGVKDEDESGLPGWTIHLDGTDNSGRPVNLTTTTRSNGAYFFFGIQPGNYTVSEVQQPGWEQTCPDIPGDGDWDIVVHSGPKDYDFGNRRLHADVPAVSYWGLVGLGILLSVGMILALRGRKTKTEI